MVSRITKYNVSEDDAVAAARLVMRRKLKVPLAPFLLLILIVAGIALWLNGDSGTRFGLVLPVLAWLVLALAGILAVLQYWVLPRQARRTFQQTTLIKEQATFEWSDVGFSLQGESGRTRIGWNDLHAWAGGESVILLMQSEMMYNLLPKAAFSDEQQADLIACITASGLKKL